MEIYHCDPIQLREILQEVTLVEALEHIAAVQKRRELRGFAGKYLS